MIGLIIAFAVGLVLSISLTPLFIRYLVHNHYGQFIRQDGPTSHMTKRGTPTMGGVVIIFATVVAWFIGTLINGGLPRGRESFWYSFSWESGSSGCSMTH